jgi:Sulfate permease family
MRADVFAGIGAGAVVIPQAMANATIAGMPVQIGLYTCMLPIAVYAALGGSRALSLTTTSTIATLSASTLLGANVAAGSVRDLITFTLLVGVILIVARVAHLGAFVDNISGAVLTGMKTGVGLTVAASQLPKLLGVSADPDATGFVRMLGSALSHLGDANAATVAGLLLLNRSAPRLPGPPTTKVVALVSPRLRMTCHSCLKKSPSRLDTPNSRVENERRDRGIESDDRRHACDGGVRQGLGHQHGPDGKSGNDVAAQPRSLIVTPPCAGRCRHARLDARVGPSRRRQCPDHEDVDRDQRQRPEGVVRDKEEVEKCGHGGHQDADIARPGGPRE